MFYFWCIIFKKVPHTYQIPQRDWKNGIKYREPQFFITYVIQLPLFDSD